ncbi:MAG: porin [Acidobacteriota bacterium]|nr:porin [Acidobacteriota bacterium]MDH3785480.1 porin [Acidobacteriota bacterium]
MRHAMLAGLFVVMSASAPAADAADAAGAERIVVANAHLIGRDAPSEDVRVNLLVVGGRLVVVTKDELVVQPNDVAVDASGGFLFGELVLGKSPSFVILDRDPREEFNVLLDTGSHVRFAMRSGAVVMNELPEVPPAPPETAPKVRAWQAYAPPPMAVPIKYYDSRKWNTFSTKPISGLFTGALVLDRQYWTSQDAASEGQVGELEDFEGGKIRGFRGGVVGTLNFRRPWQYTVFFATNTFDKGFDVRTTDEFQVFDYRLDIPLPADLTLSAGKQRETLSMERLMSMMFLPMQERAAVNDAFMPARTHGLALSGTGGEWFTWAAGAFNDWIDEDESFSDTTSAFTGRMTWVPAVSQDESNLLHLGLGLRYSDAKQPLRFGSRPEFNNAPTFADTGEVAADDALTYNLEAYWRKGPYLVGLEYFGVDVDSVASGDPFFSGYSVTGSWAVTGEMRTYRKRSGLFNALPVGRPVNQGGWGSLEAAFRYSRLDLTEGTVDGGEQEVLSLGINWWLTRKAQFSVDYRDISLDRSGIQGDSAGFNARLMLMLD